MTTDEIMALVDELDDALGGDREFDLNDITNAVEKRNNDLLKQALSEANDSEQAINKWFSYYYRGKSKSAEIDVWRVPETAPEYVVIRSESYSSKKANNSYSDDDDGFYHAAWVVGKEDDSFWIHRLPWSHSLETNQEWTLDEVRTHLGFDSEWPGGDEIESETTYRIHGDITVTVRSYEEVKNKAIQKRLTEQERSIYSERQYEWASNRFEGIDGIDPKKTSTSRGWPMHFKEDDTKSLKQIQDGLGYSEEQVRDRMEGDWKQLTANRRQKILVEMLQEEIDQAVEKPDQKSIHQRAVESIEKEIEQKKRQVNIPIGNHLAIAGSGIPASEWSYGMHSRQTEVILPGKSTLIVAHDEHETIAESVGSAVINIELLDRHQNT